MCSELTILAHGVLHEQEICRSTRWQPACLDGPRSDNMSSYRSARRTTVLLRSVVTVFSNELRAVDSSSLRVIRTGDLLWHSMGTALLDGLRDVDVSSKYTAMAEDLPLRSMATLSMDVSRDMGISLKNGRSATTLSGHTALEWAGR